MLESCIYTCIFAEYFKNCIFVTKLCHILTENHGEGRTKRTNICVGWECKPMGGFWILLNDWGGKNILFVKMETLSNDKGAEIFRQNWKGTQKTWFSCSHETEDLPFKVLYTFLQLFFSMGIPKNCGCFWSLCRTRTEFWGQGAVGKVLPEKYWRMLSQSAVPELENCNSALILCKQEMGNSSSPTVN